MTAKIALSSHICPNCNANYKLQGVIPHQEIICFKCQSLFKAPSLIEPLPENKKFSTNKTALFWLFILGFIFLCFFQIKTTPSTNAFEKANHFFSDQKYREAQKYFHTALKTSSLLNAKQQLEAHWKLALIYEKKGDLHSAMQWNQKIINDFGQIKDWKIHSARRALNRLETVRVSAESKNH